MIWCKQNNYALVPTNAVVTNPIDKHDFKSKRNLNIT